MISMISNYSCVFTHERLLLVGWGNGGACILKMNYQKPWSGLVCILNVNSAKCIIVCHFEGSAGDTCHLSAALSVGTW